MRSTERNRIVAGALLIGASVAIGAVSGEWTPPAAPAAEPFERPALPTVDALSPAPGESESTAGSHAVKDRPALLPAPAASSQPIAEPLLVLEGDASWYSDALAGRLTASGEPYDPRELIAAHRALPFGTRLRVVNLANDRAVEVTVIDRGPFIAGRIVDLSRRAAEQIGIIRSGHARVRVEVLEYGH